MNESERLYREVDAHIVERINEHYVRGMHRYIPLADGDYFDIMEEHFLLKEIMAYKIDQDDIDLKSLLSRVQKLEGRVDFVDQTARQRAFQALSMISRQLFEKYMKENIAQIQHKDGIIETFSNTAAINMGLVSKNFTVSDGNVRFNESMVDRTLKTYATGLDIKPRQVSQNYIASTPCFYDKDLGGTYYFEGSNARLSFDINGTHYYYKFPDDADTPRYGTFSKGKDGKTYLIVNVKISKISSDPLYNKAIPTLLFYDVSEVKSGVVKKVDGVSSVFAPTYQAFKTSIERTDGTMNGFADVTYCAKTDMFYGIGRISKNISEATSSLTPLATTSAVVWVVNNTDGTFFFTDIPTGVKVQTLSGLPRRTWFITGKGSLYFEHSNGTYYRFETSSKTWLATSFSFQVGNRQSMQVGDDVWFLPMADSKFFSIFVETETPKLTHYTLSQGTGSSSSGRLLMNTDKGVAISYLTSVQMDVIDLSGVAVIQLNPLTTSEEVSGVLLSISGEFDNLIGNNTIQISTDNGVTWTTPPFEYYEGIYEAYLDGSKHKTILIRCTFQYAQKKRLWNALGVMWI